MALFLNKWFFIPFLIVLLPGAMPRHPQKPFHPEKPVVHPLHVSVVEVNHNAAEKTLEISCKIFTDDFETILGQNYKTRVDLINPTDRSAMDTLVSRYILSHLSFYADGKAVQPVYLGFEHEKEAVYAYLQGSGIPAVKRIEIINKLMYDLFTDQVNIMHVSVGGKRKSSRVDYPATKAGFEF